MRKRGVASDLLSTCSTRQIIRRINSLLVSDLSGMLPTEAVNASIRYESLADRGSADVCAG